MPRSTTLCGGKDSPKGIYPRADIGSYTKGRSLPVSMSSNQWPNNKEIQPFKRLRGELSTSQGLVLRGSRIVPPESLRESILRSAHQGIVRTKQMVREKVWRPGIDHEIETMIKSCLPCQSMAPQAAPELLRPTAMPKKPWQEVHIDLCGPFPTGDSLFVCEDACTRWPEVIILKKNNVDGNNQPFQKDLRGARNTRDGGL